ncbi:MAG: hypothetical protein DHS20C15_07870 [Planctomycetota bacterium]|nr:MAG: hypothetical protein DHS20C15_07870 [Planctomycetota bacterium]
MGAAQAARLRNRNNTGKARDVVMASQPTRREGRLKRRSGWQSAVASARSPAPEKAYCSASAALVGAAPKA